MTARVRPSALTGLTTYLLSQVATIAKRQLDDQLSSQGFRLRHMAVLAALADGDTPSQLELGRRLGLDPSDVTQTVDDLGAAGFAHRHVDPDDRRRRLVAISAAGSTELQRLVALADSIADDLLAPLAQTRRERLHKDLLRVLGAYDEDSAADRSQD